MTPATVYQHPGARRLARSTRSPEDAMQAAALRVHVTKPSTWGQWWACVRCAILDTRRRDARAPTPTEDGNLPEISAHPDHSRLEAVSDVADLLAALPRHQRNTVHAMMAGAEPGSRALRDLRSAAVRWRQENT